MRSDLLDAVAALDLGRTIFSKIKANLVWACFYNVLMIPLAMGFFLPWGWHLHPMMAGLAMAFSSVSVVASSLTLRVSLIHLLTIGKLIDKISYLWSVVEKARCGNNARRARRDQWFVAGLARPDRRHEGALHLFGGEQTTAQQRKDSVQRRLPGGT